MTNEELVKLYQDGNKRALDELMKQNRGIVFKIANKFFIEGVSYFDIEDIEQEGFIGLALAADRYNFNNPKKAKFTTYAIHWIHQRMYSFVVGSSSREIENNKLYKNCTSINVPIGKDDDIEFGETIEGIDYGFENIEERIYLEQLRNDLEEAMYKNNSLKEREILKFRYGWDTSSMTINEVGDMFGISAERVRQLQIRALRRLRNSEWFMMNREAYINDGFVGKKLGTKKFSDIDYEIDNSNNMIKELREKFKGFEGCF